jgi:hypothetical protein
MSNLLLNIRFGSWHFQVMRDLPFIRISRNEYHDRARLTDPDWKWFEIM